MRFHPPSRDAVDPSLFDHPAFEAFRSRRALLNGASWPSNDELKQHLGVRTHPVSGVRLEFVPQTPALLADGRHYETRIFDIGVIATRAESWHDLFNALMWLDRFELKCAVNTAYVREFALRKTGPRSRAQCALTHFDEGGAIVALSDDLLLEHWDAHDWPGLFFEQRVRWQASTQVLLFGHALLEQRLVPQTLSVAKCLVVKAGAISASTLLETVAAEIIAGRVLCDPQELRPLPLAGLANWHADNQSESFYRETPCFRPLRPGRRYPAPISIDLNHTQRKPACVNI